MIITQTRSLPSLADFFVIRDLYLKSDWIFLLFNEHNQLSLYFIQEYNSFFYKQVQKQVTR